MYQLQWHTRITPAASPLLSPTSLHYDNSELNNLTNSTGLHATGEGNGKKGLIMKDTNDLISAENHR